jgi:hypothetical protein
MAGLFVDRARRIGAVTLANSTYGRCSSVPLDLMRILASYEPPLPIEWVPEPELAQGEELLGHWYWGNTQMTMTIAGGILQLTTGYPCRFSPIGPDLYRGRDGYFAGERLRVIRDGDRITHLDLATFTLTRTPYGG